MNRRSAVIQAIAILFAAIAKGQINPATRTAYELDLQKGPIKSQFPRKCHAVGGNQVSCDYEEIPEPDYALVVVYGDRVVRLTATEIMDALEGK